MRFVFGRRRLQAAVAGSLRCPYRQNELGLLEFIHLIVETFDSYFEGVVRFYLSVGIKVWPTQD
jgi:hypothetical protein